MRSGGRVLEAITFRSRVILVVALLVTALLGAGVSGLESDTTLQQFESDSPEAEALDYGEERFTLAVENTTTTQVVVHGDDVLTRESLIDSLEFQRELRETDAIGPTLASDTPTAGVENVVATSVIRRADADELETRAAALERRGNTLDATATRLEGALEETGDLQREYERLNDSYEAGDVSDDEYDDEATAIEAALDDAVENATADLGERQTARFERAVSSVRSIEREAVSVDRRYESGELSEAEYEFRRDRLEDHRAEAFLDGTVGVLGDEYDELRVEAEELEAEREALESLEQPPLDEQIDALEGVDQEEFEATLEEVLGGEGPTGDVALRLMPTTYEPGSLTADARTLLVRQTLDDSDDVEPGVMGEDVVDAQLELRELVSERDDREVAVFGFGIVAAEIDRSLEDSLAVVGPLALLFVVAVLFVAYRDPLDIALGVAGVVTVLLWTFGVMGWVGIAFNQLFVAVPVLLIGLSIDYAIHVFMRYREQHETRSVSDRRMENEASREQRVAVGTAADGRSPMVEDTVGTPTSSAEDAVRTSMTVALAGVGVALVWVTVTTSVGFLANLTSPIAPIREFGIVSAIGILSALIVFGVLVPATKVELDEFLESRGFDRRNRAFGTGGGRLSAALAGGVVAARRAPAAVLVVTLVLTAGGVYGATHVDTTFDEEEFLADEQPAWVSSVLGSSGTGEYRVGDDLEYVSERFHREDARAQILLRGDVTDGDTLQGVATAERAAADSNATYTLPSGEADVRSPLSVMEATAAESESFNASFRLADRTGDGVPDQNLEGLYDQLFELDPQAASTVIHRTDDGEYEALRVVIAIDGASPTGETAAELGKVADETELVAATDEVDGADAGWDAIATGPPIVNAVVERDVLETVVRSLALTLVAVLVVLALASRTAGHSATLGVVTLLPVVCTVSWILGTMALLGLSFNVLTGTVTSLTVGLGVAYTIHVSSRYTLELERQGEIWPALTTTVTATGGALLGSAATTVGGFGVLVFATVPLLRQFGLIVALTIAYAFLASVVVLPTLLVYWTRYVAPELVSNAGADEAATRRVGDEAS